VSYLVVVPLPRAKPYLQFNEIIVIIIIVYKYIFSVLAALDKKKVLPIVASLFGLNMVEQGLLYGPDDRGFILDRNKRLFFTALRSLLGSTQLPMQWIFGDISSGLKRIIHSVHCTSLF
jgi:hypothetical protein